MLDSKVHNGINSAEWVVLTAVETSKFMYRLFCIVFYGIFTAFSSVENSNYASHRTGIGQVTNFRFLELFSKVSTMKFFMAVCIAGSSTESSTSGLGGSEGGRLEDDI